MTQRALERHKDVMPNSELLFSFAILWSCRHLIVALKVNQLLGIVEWEYILSEIDADLLYNIDIKSHCG